MIKYEISISLPYFISNEKNTRNKYVCLINHFLWHCCLQERRLSVSEAN